MKSRIGTVVRSGGLSHQTNNGKCRGGHNAAQGNVTGDEHNQNEEHQHNQQARGASAMNAPAAVATPLPPLKRSHTVNMWPRMATKAASAANRKRCGYRWFAAVDHTDWWDRRLEPMCASQPEGKRHGRVSLQGIEEQSRDRQALRSGARNVCRSDIAAAGLADILPAKDAHQQIAEGNRAQQIGDNNDDEDEFGQV